MASVAFDTLRFANRLKTAGVPPAHAEAEAEALAEVLETNLQGFAEAEARNGEALTLLRADMQKGFAQVDQRFAELEKSHIQLKGEMLLLKWMLGVVIGGVGVVITGVVGLVAKAFF
ncbi:MAG TPA: DUF1640 domain-containing protein [Xylella sp.]